jgi:hypothetical protein
MTIKKGLHAFFRVSENRQFPKCRRAGFRRCCLVGDFEYFNFLHFECPRTREKRFPVQSGVVGVTGAEAGSVTVGATVAKAPSEIVGATAAKAS